MYITFVEGGYWHPIGWNAWSFITYAKAWRVGSFVFDVILLKRGSNPFRRWYGSTADKEN